MRFLKILSNRITIVTLAIIAQLAAIIAASYYFEDLGKEINLVLKILSFLTVCWVINGKSDVSIKLTWIVFILVTPVFGSIMYLLTGGKGPRKRLIRALEDAEKKNNGSFKLADVSQKLSEESEELYAQSRYLSQLGFGVLENTKTKYYPSGEAAFSTMLEELEKAEKFIFIEYFIMEKGEMLDSVMEILERKAKSGVDVRIIYDDVGSLFYLPQHFCEETEAKNIKCMAFNPFVPFLAGVMNNRSHRKIMVIDSRIAFSGGINMADEYINRKERFGYWKDNVFSLEGDGAVAYTLMFLNMWNGFRDKGEDIGRFLPLGQKNDAKGYVQPFCDTPLDDDTVSVDVYLNAINGAKRYIYIFTPYLAPGQDIMGALALAAKRGVDVRLLLPGIPDKKTVFVLSRSHYEPLLSAGVKIYEFTPGFLHAKGFVSDDRIACAGTINLDFRSLQHHFECGCLFYNADIVGDIKNDMLDTMQKSRQITRYKSRGGIVASTYNAVLRLISPLM